MAVDNPAPPPLEPNQFFLKTEPLPGVAASRFGGLYLRQHSAANPAVVLTREPPKFLRANVADAEARVGIAFKSWLPRHAGREWGLVLLSSGVSGPDTRLWERVEIAEDGNDRTVRFERVTDRDADEIVATGDELVGGQEWAGWMVCEWLLGHPQLFWITDRLGESEIPHFCERVRIVKDQTV
ncbi:hypothetical protein B0T25DRAFT_496559 [Lasiosphaeria hispida]|uniref:DUF7907 domain-containing protein n=1 Tax=Lasiosphaeria hispida TaxID=260671 RepID=A0AAJ0MIS2_9PEZI|nr:hypothetical protein B0T25DRAFT_496559 [Lasiosphaeria hispida]